MFTSRFVVSKRCLVLVLLAVVVSLGVQGYQDLEEEQNPYSDPSSWRMKRKNQISCHCCSHSFNSHCCLQCMNRLRVGKRSEANHINDISQWTDGSDETNEEHAVVEENIQLDYLADLANHALMCSCCVRVLNQDASLQKWPCCRKCQSLSNGLIKHEITLENLE